MTDALTADIVDSRGGSSLLLRILNQLGVCASSETLSRFIQHKVQSKQTGETEPDLDPQEFTVVSADNIDFMHSYARIFSESKTAAGMEQLCKLSSPKPLNSSSLATRLFNLIG